MFSHNAFAQTVTSPSAPQNLHTTTVSSSQINLSWTAPSSNGGSTITGYKVERSTNNGTTWTTVVANNGCQCDGYLDQGLAASMTYAYRVSAINSVGTGSSSNMSSATTNSATPPPPPNETATIFHDDYSSSAGWTQLGTEVTVDSSQFPNMVKFNNVTGGNGVTEERVYKQLPSTLPAYNWVLDTNYMFTSSRIPSEYPVSLTINSNNPESQPLPSSAQAIRIHHGTGSDQLNVDFVNLESAGIQISPNVQYYLQLERTQTQLMLSVFSDPARTMQVSGSPVSLTVDPTALINLNYIQHSGSFSSGSARTITSQVTNTTIYIVSNPNGNTAPSAPQNLVAKAVSSSQINLSWVAPSNNGSSAIMGYDIERSSDNGANWSTVVSNTGSTATTYSDTGLMRDTTYLYRISAINSAGTGQPSNQASATTLLPPAAPVGLTAVTISSSQINLSWNAPADNGGSSITGYEVERSKDDLSFGSFSNSTSDTFFSAPNATTFADTGLASSTTYNYTVFAKNSVGSSRPSNTSSATTSATAPPPTGITLNNIQSTSGTVSSSPYQITLANFNAGTGNNNLLVVGISANNAAVTSVTFGGVQLTQEVSSFNNNDAEFWYLKNPTGTGNIVVTMGGSTSVVVGAYSFSGVDQTTPIPTSVTKYNTSSSSPTISITTQYPNSWVLDVPSIYGGVTLGSPTCTQQWNVNVPNAITGASSSTTQASSGSVTCSWTASNGGDLWDDAAIEIKASG